MDQPQPTPPVAEQPHFAPADETGVAAPHPAGKRSALGVWVWIVNGILYSLPLLAFILIFIFFLLLAVGRSGAELLLFFFVMGVGIYWLMALMAVVGAPVLILNLVYLVRVRPSGAKRIWLIISTALVVIGYFVGAVVGVGVGKYI